MPARARAISPPRYASAVVLISPCSILLLSSFVEDLLRKGHRQSIQSMSCLYTLSSRELPSFLRVIAQRRNFALDFAMEGVYAAYTPGISQFGRKRSTTYRAYHEINRPMTRPVAM